MIWMVHNLVNQNLDGLVIVAGPRCGRLKDTPVIALVRKTTVRIIRFMIRNRAETVYQV